MDDVPAVDPAGAGASHGAPTEEEIRRRAEEISRLPDAGTPEENWLRAERELVDATRAAELVQAREQESESLRHAHWFTQSHP